jgi:hypothetical protein
MVGGKVGFGSIQLEAVGKSKDNSCEEVLCDVEGSWVRESSLLVPDVMGRKWLEWDEKSEKEGAGW